MAPGLLLLLLLTSKSAVDSGQLAPCPDPDDVHLRCPLAQIANRPITRQRIFGHVGRGVGDLPEFGNVEERGLK